MIGHRIEVNLKHAYEHAGKLDAEVRMNIKQTIGSCMICKKHERLQGTPNKVVLI